MFYKEERIRKILQVEPGDSPKKRCIICGMGELPMPHERMGTANGEPVIHLDLGNIFRPKPIRYWVSENLCSWCLPFISLVSPMKEPEPCSAIEPQTQAHSPES